MAEDQNTSTFNPGNIQFLQHSLPALPDGDYTVKVEQTLTDSEGKIIGDPTENEWDFTQAFSILGPRYSMDANLVNAAFPPSNGLGDYYNALPHVILTRSSLPWERSPCDDPDSGRTWLVLLLFEQGEDFTTSTIRLGDWVPANQLEAGQDPDDQVVVIDVDPTLLLDLLPDFQDLEWLAHCRQDLDESGNPQGGIKSVIMGNRLPKQGGRNVVHLVSIENLYTGTGIEPDLEPMGNGKVRLASLYNWAFDVLDEKYSFNGLLSALVPGQFMLPPVRDPQEPDPNIYLSQGLVPIPHRFRNGQQTVSWYRSPLAPGPRDIELPLPVKTSDELLIYDYTIGMYETSYAAAWELGRLMILNSKSFSNTLFQWKRSLVQNHLNLNQISKTAHLPIVWDKNRWLTLEAQMNVLYRMNRVDADDQLIENQVGSGSPGQLSGTPQPTMDDQFGAALAFSGNEDTVEVIAPSGAWNDDFGFSFWIKTEQKPSTDNGQVILKLYNTQNPNTQILVYNFQGQLNFLFPNGTIQVGEIADGAWHHFVLTLSPSKNVLKYTLDGRDLETTEYTPPSKTGGNFFDAMWLGNDPQEIFDPFQGYSAQFRNYSTLLTLGDLTEIREVDTAPAPLHPWFNQLSLLNGLPALNLIPDPNMLPVESMRFFFLDRNWVDMLLDGAFSIGRVNKFQYEFDAEIMESMVLNPNPEVTGFLLRSEVVRGWPDLLVDGYNIIQNNQNPIPDENRLELLRMDRISDSILLCMFEGNIKTVDIHLKAEAVHFGVDPDYTTEFTKELRDQNGLLNGSNITENFKNEDLRIIDIDQLARDIETNVPFPSFTSAQFGMEMIEGAQMVRFINQES